MSTLQISLAVVGVLVILGVLLQGVWTAHKNQPKKASPTGARGSAEAGSARSAEPTGDALDKRQEPAFDSDLAALTSFIAPEKKAALDVLIDVIVPIAIDSQVSGEAALAAMPTTRRAGSKPFSLEGLSINNGKWEPPAAGQRYIAFQAGVQLANRMGALNKIEFSEFVMKAHAFADAINGAPEFPDMQHEVARARELDQFASEHDVQLSFTLRAASTAWSPGYLQQNAARLGFIAGAMPGRMVLPARQSGQAPILGLSFDSHAAMAEDPDDTALRELTLSLDVPNVARSERPFERMCEAALLLAKTMDGLITDDKGNPVRAEAMEGVHARLQRLYDTLDGRELSAGSVLARRLFS